MSDQSLPQKQKVEEYKLKLAERLAGILGDNYIALVMDTIDLAYHAGDLDGRSHVIDSFKALNEKA